MKSSLEMVLLNEFLLPINATDDQHLVIQLRGHTHVQVHVQVVVVGHEGLGRGATGNHVHHRRLYLQEAHLVEETAHVGDDLSTNLKLVFFNKK